MYHNTRNSTNTIEQMHILSASDLNKISKTHNVHKQYTSQNTMQKPTLSRNSSELEEENVDLNSYTNKKAASAGALGTGLLSSNADQVFVHVNSRFVFLKLFSAENNIIERLQNRL